MSKKEPALYFGPVPLYHFPLPRAARGVGNDLDFEADEQLVLGVPCATPWCNAFGSHDARWTPCGDKDGDYTGVHQNRVRRAQRWAVQFPEQTYRFTPTDHLVAGMMTTED